MTQEQKELWRNQLCTCGHRRAQHSGKWHEEDCAACTTGWQFCKCKRFKEGQFNSQEEIEMAKSKAGKKEKGERQPRTQLVYEFNAEKARTLRDEQYKDKKNLVAVTLRVLCASRREGFTFDQMAELVKEETGTLPTRAQFPLNKLRTEKVLKASKERAAASAKPKAEKKARKPRTKKATPEVTEEQAASAAA